jgi:hypothetical protein
MDVRRSLKEHRDKPASKMISHQNLVSEEKLVITEKALVVPFNDRLLTIQY